MFAYHKLILVVVCFHVLFFSFVTKAFDFRHLTNPQGLSIVEENEWYIPPSTVYEDVGLSEQQFYQVLNKIQAIYNPIVTSKGGILEVYKNWSDGTVNSYATRYLNHWVVQIMGGIARLPVQTPDGLAGVFCHELGHHLGGAPKTQGNYGFTDWASIEGQSDYFAVMKCLRRVFAEDNNIELVSRMQIDPSAKEACYQVWSNQADRALCQRVAMVGMTLAQIFRIMKNEAADVAFNTPDPGVVDKTNPNHPATQCRLDTYFQSALCPIHYTIEISDQNPLIGSCNTSQGYRLGVRPVCWYKP